MKREARSYSVEFKQKAVELTYARGSIVDVCRELDIPRSVLGRWRKESKEYGDNGFPGKGNPKLTDGQREIVEPVSYTHLRAHETVLDLVCRLLLEKKK